MTDQVIVSSSKISKTYWGMFTVFAVLLALVVVLAATLMRVNYLVSQKDAEHLTAVRELMDERMCFLSAALRAHTNGNHEQGITEVLQCEKVAKVPKATSFKVKNPKLT